MERFLLGHKAPVVVYDCPPTGAPTAAIVGIPATDVAATDARAASIPATRVPTAGAGTS